ncbi:MAG: beta-phosphoglucomutase family hydrolase [Nitriliruptorales bacterium]|nr:beta-phosphoglucomutase family hydrolase [Nitriliruptorales bacterium]
MHIDPEQIDAVIFDTDGVITDTAAVHKAAWKELFDDFLRQRADPEDRPFEPFTDEDYRLYVDGKPRYDGVRSFLESRGIELPEGDPSDPPGDETVQALGNRKNAGFREALERDGAEAFAGTVDLIHRLRDAGIATGVISASRNCKAVLDAAGVSDLFDTRVDGNDAEELGFPGKPDPAVFEVAAERLEVAVDRAVVVEDALAGVEAGHRGSFALVIGVDRIGHAEDLLEHGADVVVSDLGEVTVGSEGEPR